MNAYLGGRRRFLYRLIVYTLMPWVGLLVLLRNFQTVEGRLLGLIGIIAGSLALYLLLARLRDPKSAVRFALRPVQTTRQAVLAWPPGTDLREFLAERIPDVRIEERTAVESSQTALAVGDAVLVYVIEPSSGPEDPGALEEIVSALRTPLREEPLLLVVRGGSSQARRIVAALPGVHVLEKPL
jgi:hypothetical protein